MKKKVVYVSTLAVMAIIATICFAAGYQPRTYTVATSSVLIVPHADPAVTNMWKANTAYSYGDYINMYTNNIDRYYWCVNAGTTGASHPSWTLTDVADNTIVWRWVNPKRDKLYIVNNSAAGTNSLYLGFNSAAVANAGIRLNGAGGSFNMDTDAWQGEIYAIRAAGSGTVTTQELP